MTANMQDVCEYRGRLLVIKRPEMLPSLLKPNPNELVEHWFALTGFHSTTSELELEALRGVPPPGSIATACWRGCLGHFLFEGDRLYLRAVAVYPPTGDVPASDEWVVREIDDRIWDWSLCGPFTDEFLEYTFTEPREVPFSRIRLYEGWRAEDWVSELEPPDVVG